MQEAVTTMSSLQKDFVASFLRSQLATLQSILAEIENSDRLEGGYIEESLRRVEKELCRFRRLYINN